MISFSSSTDSLAIFAVFSDKSTNSGLAQEKNPVLHIKSKFFVVITHAWYSWPESTVIFGNVATCSTIPALAGQYMAVSVQHWEHKCSGNYLDTSLPKDIE